MKTTHFVKRNLASAILSLASALLISAETSTGTLVLINKTKDGLALKGFDPVAYFTDHKASKGNPGFTSEHDGATYLFVNEEHKALFDAAPEKYLPAYGGFCGYAASIGKVRPADPMVWSIVDGQLVVQQTKGAAELWEKDVPGNKAKADRLWPRLVEVKAGKRDPIDGLLSKSVLANLD